VRDGASPPRVYDATTGQYGRDLDAVRNGGEQFLEFLFDVGITGAYDEAAIYMGEEKVAWKIGNDNPKSKNKELLKF